MLKFLDIWVKKEIEKKSSSSNVEIFGDLGQKRFFQSDLKKPNISLNGDIFGNMGQKRYFQSDHKITSVFGRNVDTKIWPKIDIFKVITKNRQSMVQKRFFFSK